MIVKQMVILMSNVKFAKYYKEFIKDLDNGKHSIYSIPGGRNSAKSSTMYIYSIKTVMNDGNVMFIRRYYKSIEGSSYSGILKWIGELGLNNEFIIRKSPLRIICKSTGYCINFGGLDSPDKINSAESLKGYYVLCVFEEAQEIENKLKSDKVIQTFNRGKGSDLLRIVFIFNPPPNKNHWTNTELRHNIDNYQLVLEVNYNNIPKSWVGKKALDYIHMLKNTNPKLYRYAYLGEPLSAEDTVFENVELQEITDKQIDTWFKEDEYLFCGLDFGYHPDVNAGVFMKYDTDNRFLYIFREFYNGLLNNKQISDGLESAGFSKDYLIVADNNEKDIADLQSMGWRIQSAVKGPGSVEAGFKWLQGIHKIIIDEQRCPNTSREFLEYHYCFDKSGTIRHGYKDTDNQSDHAIAAVRYGMEPYWRRAGA